MILAVDIGEYVVDNDFIVLYDDTDEYELLLQFVDVRVGTIVYVVHDDGYAENEANFDDEVDADWVG